MLSQRTILVFQGFLQILVCGKSDGIGEANVYFLTHLLIDLALEEGHPIRNTLLHKLLGCELRIGQASKYAETADKNDSNEQFGDNLELHIFPKKRE